jgi:hypothetical protein
MILSVSNFFAQPRLRYTVLYPYPTTRQFQFNLKLTPLAEMILSVSIFFGFAVKLLKG